MFTHNLYAVFSFMYCMFKSYLLAVLIGRNTNKHNGLKHAHLPLENLNLDISRVRIDPYTEFVYSTLS